jgi:hypothetical protein
MKVGRTGTLGHFDIRKCYTPGFHLSSIDSFLAVRNIYALWSRHALRQWACNPSSSSSESRESDGKSESRSLAVSVGSVLAQVRPPVERYILHGEREALPKSLNLYLC